MKRIRYHNKAFRQLQIANDLKSLPETITAWPDPIKQLKRGLKKAAGRNHHGRITVRHRGGGHKRSYRLLQTLTNAKWRITAIEYDPNRTGWIAQVKKDPLQLSTTSAPSNIAYNENRNIAVITQTTTHDSNFITPNGNETILSMSNPLKRTSNVEKAGYILLTEKLHVGDSFKVCSIHDSALGFDTYNLGDRVPLCRLSVGTIIHSLSYSADKSTLVRAAGTSALVMINENQPETCKRVFIKLPSGKSIWLAGNSYATVGQVCNVDHQSRIYAKAGVIRWFGIRPTVRGVAMNPVDHPHGGKTRGARPCVSPWGKLTKGKPTSKARIRKNFKPLH